MLGISHALTPTVVKALQQVRRPSVIWLQLQECTGCVESVLRSADPSIGDLVLDLVLLSTSSNPILVPDPDPDPDSRGSYPIF